MEPESVLVGLRAGAVTNLPRLPICLCLWILGKTLTAAFYSTLTLHASLYMQLTKPEESPQKKNFFFRITPKEKMRAFFIRKWKQTL